MRITVHTLKQVTTCDSCSKNAAGNFLFRRVFFYKMGGTAEKYASGLVVQLQEAGVKFEVIGQGEVNKPFKGGAPVRQSSHWWVEVKIL
jgi:hypothetical protein